MDLMSVIPIAARTSEEDGPARSMDVVAVTGIRRQSEEVSDKVTASRDESDKEEKEESEKRSGGGGGGHWKSEERRV